MDLLRFASIPYSPPQEHRCDLIRAWYKTNTLTTPSFSILPELFLMGGTYIVRQGRNALFYRQPTPTEFGMIHEFLKALEDQIIAPWCKTNKDIVARPTHEDEQLTAQADLIMDTTMVQIQPGSSPADMKRLELLVELFETAHLMRQKGHTINKVVLFQPLTGLWLEMDIADWDGSELDTYIRQKIGL
jgi:hypothetical protein